MIITLLNLVYLDTDSIQALFFFFLLLLFVSAATVMIITESILDVMQYCALVLNSLSVVCVSALIRLSSVSLSLLVDAAVEVFEAELVGQI